MAKERPFPEDSPPSPVDRTDETEGLSTEVIPPSHRAGRLRTPDTELPTLLSAGESFGPYDIKRLLGRGGMGEVHEAVDTRSGHRMAIKVLSRDSSWSPDRRERFLREGRLAASISHTNSLYVYGTEEIRGVPVIAMEIASGGTLRDRVERDGPLPAAQAVDAALDMIEGLKAAHEAGILHRDIKPANCFVDQWGRVKIGDYGLAQATGDVEATRLTLTGGLVATPAYASPEQLRGEPLDLRADIYSVGGTIYYLLTGKTPHRGETPMQMLASVMSVAPEPLRTARPDVPTDLSRVVMKCLAKSPADRIRDYDELKARLAPFGTARSSPARLSDRFRAGLFDMLLFSPILVASVGPLMAAGARQEPTTRLMNLLPELGLFIRAICCTLFEALSARSPGQRIVGIWLTDPAGGPPRTRGVIVRNLLFYAGPILGDLNLDWHPAIFALLQVSPLFLYVTAREGNRWTSLLDRWSGTRAVVRRRTAGASAGPAHRAAPSGFHAGGIRIGPYDVMDSGGAIANRTLVASDARTGRHVWIRTQEEGTPPIPLERRDMVRPGRLRWLNGSRRDGSCWDAYEGPEGRPLAEVASSPIPWTAARSLLLSLAEELAAIHAGQDAVPPLSLDLVWVTSRGTALLLDFPPPTAPPAAPRRDEPPGSIPDEEELQRFLSAVAGLLLFGSHGAPPDETEIMSRFPIAPPCSAIRIWRDSSKGSFASLPALVESLKAVQHGESRIRPLRRFFQFLPLLVLLLAMDFSSIITNSVRGRAEYEHSVLVKAYRAAGALTTTANDPSPAMAVEERRALEILLSGPWREALRDTSSMLPQDGRGRARATLRTWTRIAASNAVPSPDSLAWAEARIRSSRRADILADPPRITVLGMVKFGIENAYAILAIFIIPFFLLFGLLWRGGLGLLLFNQVLVDRRGRLASRRRAFGRTLITCSPFLVHWVYIAAGRGSGPTPVLLIGFAVFLGGVVWALLRPSRSLQDRLAGTWIVPR